MHSSSNALEHLMGNSAKRVRTASSRQLISRATRPWQVFSITVALALGCSARSVDLDGDGGKPNVNSNPDAIAPSVAPFLEDRENATKVVVDEKRIYWLEALHPRCCNPGEQPSVAVRSCLKDDCRETITTYVSFPSDSNASFPRDFTELRDYAALAVAGGNVYWVVGEFLEPEWKIVTCPAGGCAGAPRVILTTPPFTSMAADESYVYWTSPRDSAVFRLPISGTGTPETIALNETSPDQLVVHGADAYWIERTGTPHGAIKRAPKQGGGPTVTLAMDQNLAMALNVDTEFVYWTNADFGGSIVRCSVSGCPTGPETMVVGQPSIRALAQDGKSIDWITPVEMTAVAQRAAVKRCPIDGCASAVETLAVQIFYPGTLSMAVDGSDLYWPAQGLPDAPLSYIFPRATIYRYRN
jgi:hypothetical protein